MRVLSDNEHLSDNCQFTILNDGTSKGRPQLDDGRGFPYTMKSRIPSEFQQTREMTNRTFYAAKLNLAPTISF